MHRSAAAIVFVLVLLGTATAQAVTIDFTAPDRFVTSSPYLEDGFVVDGTGVSAGGILDNELVEGFFELGEFYSIRREDGGLFRFMSFNFRLPVNVVVDGFELLGLSAGTQVADFGSFTPRSASPTTIAISDGTLIDELRIVATGPNISSPAWDNFVFDPVVVPLPSTAALLATGLIALGAAARRRR